MKTYTGESVVILGEKGKSIDETLISNRKLISGEESVFFTPRLEDLHDPFLMPDMKKAVKRVQEAREKDERVVIFGDYDVDGVSSTAILFRFLKEELGIEVSYRLPHRIHDGYGLKSYFFDELAQKGVKLVITVDCGTRDIEPIQHAKSLGIDVIVTDHHAVPENIPEEVIAIVNPKRKDSVYPFPNLAGAGVAFKFIHALLLEEKMDVYGKLIKYIDLASLGTVADCMPLIGENRTITSLGLKQMKSSESSALRKFVQEKDEVEGNADIIGFQIGPRINAAGRMDSPLKALHWLLATEDRVDGWLEEIENLNTQRQEIVKTFTEDALMNIDENSPVLFYIHEKLEHGLIGLVAGKLTEAYNKPSIALCSQHENPKNEVNKREYERKNGSNEREAEESPTLLVASCRSPEWCNLVELLDECKDFFVRYGGHRQAAGFTIRKDRFEAFQRAIVEKFHEKYDHTSLPKKTLSVETIISPTEISLETLETIDRFRPFGIGNRKPIFLIENLTIAKADTIGKDKNHLSFQFEELPDIKCLLWNFDAIFGAHPPARGDILSPLFTIEKNIWNNKTSLQLMVQNFLRL